MSESLESSNTGPHGAPNPHAAPFTSRGNAAQNWADGSAWFIIATILELALIVGCAAMARYIAKHRPGADAAEWVWSRSSELQRQPVPQPLLFAICISLGARGFVVAPRDIVVALMGLTSGPLSVAILGVLGICWAAWVSIVVYRIVGGTRWKSAAVGNLLTHWLVFIVLGLPPDKERPWINVMPALLGLILLTAGETPFYIWGGLKRLPATADRIHITSASKSVSLTREMAIVSTMLTVVYALREFMMISALPFSYASRLAGSLAPVMLLAASALASVVTVNRSVANNRPQWQWLAFLTPIPAVLVSNSILFMYTNSMSGWKWLVGQVFLLTSSGTSGVLGGYYYLKVAAGHAESTADTTDKKLKSDQTNR